MKQVKAVVLYQCGRCSHTAKRTYTADDDGLLVVPTVFCGRCVKQKHFTTMSSVVTETSLEETDTKATDGRLARRGSVSEERPETAPVERKAEGWVDTGTTDGEKRDAGRNGPGRVPPVSPKKGSAS